MLSKILPTALATTVGLGLAAVAACDNNLDPGGPGYREVTGNGGTSGSSASGGTGLVGTGSEGSLLATGGYEDDGGIVACEAQTEPARLTPVNIIFMIDKSGSMGAQDTNQDGDLDDDVDWDNTAFRWDPVSAALVAFFQNPGAEGLYASLEFFPQGGDPSGPGTGACSINTYATPAVLLQSLDDPAAAQLLATRVENTTPSGGTPTLPALQGALEYARKTMADNPGSTSVVVLVTDGMPGVARIEDGNYYNEKCFCFGEPDCPEQDEIPYVAQAAQAAASEGIPTYVIGMGEVEPDPLHTIAAAGGTEQAFIVDIGDAAVTQAQLAAALSSVRGVQAPCRIQIPPPPEGESFDKLKVNVEFVSGSGVVQPIFYAGALAAQLGGTQLTCPNPGPPAPSNPWFWTYNDENAPAEIVLCESACAQTEGDAAGKVNVAYGCATQVPEVR